MTERWFLCSHSARTETRLLASIDLVMSILYLIIFILLTYGVIEYPHLLQQYVDEDREDRQDLAKLLTYGPVKQGIFLAILILRPSVSFLLAILFIVGAQKRNYILIRVCFIISVTYIVVDLILLVPRTIYTQNGKLYVIVYLANFIYMLYELRVVYALMSDLKTLWEEQKAADEEAEEPQTEDTVVTEADPPTPDENDKF